MSEIKFIGPWLRDESAFDPSVRVRSVLVDGRTFVLRNVHGPGWSMIVRPASNPHFVSDMADWENWGQVVVAARRCVEVEARRKASRQEHANATVTVTCRLCGAEIDRFATGPWFHVGTMRTLCGEGSLSPAQP